MSSVPETALDKPKPGALTLPKKPIDTLRDLLEKAKASMAMVVPKHVTPERLIKLALVAASRNPTLLQCAPTSIVQGVMTAAQLGLDCGGVLGSAYLVPYKNNKTGKYEAQLIVGYRGLVDLARRSGEIESIEAHVVHQEDTFEVAFGLEPVLLHRPNLTGEDPGPLVLVYAIARLKGGGRQVEVMTRAEIDRIRNRSRAGNSGPWVTDYEEMARKTVVRRLCKYLPLSPEMAEALTIEDRSEGGVPPIELIAPEPEGDVVEGTVVDAEAEKPQTKASALAAKLNGRGPAPAPVPAQEREPGDDSDELGLK